MKSYSILALLFISFSTSAFGNDCPLCDEKIIKQQTVFETEYYVVLVDYMPRMKGHLLVVPKRHVFKAHELTGQEWQDLSVVIPKVVAVFKDFLGTDQYMILEKMVPRLTKKFPTSIFIFCPSILKNGWMSSISSQRSSRLMNFRQKSPLSALIF